MNHHDGNRDPVATASMSAHDPKNAAMTSEKFFTVCCLSQSCGVTSESQICVINS
jgi:hypothetical protein